CSTYLHVIGLAEACTGHSLNTDTRVTGWLLEPEWHPQANGTFLNSEQTILNRYWGFFYSLVHWNGSQTGFAGLYMASPDDSQWPNKIDTYISAMAGQTKPDLWGLAWYGNSPYNVANISNDLGAMVTRMQNDAIANGFSIPTSAIAFMEGGTDQ